MKLMYEYKAVQVPEQAKKRMDDLYIILKQTDKKLRKADMWLQAVELYAEKMGQEVNR